MILDVLILLFAIYGIYIGQKKGAIKGVLKLIGSILSLILTYVFAKPLTEYIIKQYDLNEFIKTKINSYYPNIEQNIDNVSTQYLLNNNDFFKNLPSSFQDLILTKLQDTNVSYTFIDIIANLITHILVFVALLFVLRLIIGLIIKIIIKIFKLPVFKQINKSVGMIIYGIHQFIIGVMIASLIQVIVIYNNIAFNTDSIILEYIFSFIKNSI